MKAVMQKKHFTSHRVSVMFYRSRTITFITLSVLLCHSTGSLVPRWKAAMLKPNNSYDFFWKSNFSDVQMSASKALRNNSFELCSRPLIDSASNTRHRQMSSHISRQWVGSFLISSTYPECQDLESTALERILVSIYPCTAAWCVSFPECLPIIMTEKVRIP